MTEINYVKYIYIYCVCVWNFMLNCLIDRDFHDHSFYWYWFKGNVTGGALPIFFIIHLHSTFFFSWNLTGLSIWLDKTSLKLSSHSNICKTRCIFYMYIEHVDKISCKSNIQVYLQICFIRQGQCPNTKKNVVVFCVWVA